MTIGSIAVAKSLLSSKLGVWCAVIIPFFTTIAVTEAFQGQLVIALIAALPPTGAVIVAIITLQRGQARTLVALDGKLDKLMAAEKGVSKAEGVKEERDENRMRVAEAAPAVTAAIVAATVAAVSASPGTPAKVEVVNKDHNPVSTKLSPAKPETEAESSP